MSKKFQKKVEDFVCEKCGKEVKGTGFTNHCPECLWSKHVDNNPGDREATCQGLMKPIAVEGTSPYYDIVHRCEKCGYQKRNKINPADNFMMVLAIASAAKEGREGV